MPLPVPGTAPGSDQLDGPPPSPALRDGSSAGPSPSSPEGGSPMAGMAAPLSMESMPPDVLTGMLQAGQKMSETLDSFATMTPEMSADWALVKDTLLRALARLVSQGGGPTSPTNAGPNFPGGGFDRGGMPSA